MVGSGNNTAPKIPSINDLTSVFYLSSSDSPGMSITQITLNGENYHLWKRAFQRALISKNKSCFINGTLDRSKVEDDDKTAWDKCNAMVVSWIFNCVDKSIQTTIISFENARELWIELEQRYTQGHGPRIYQLKGELNDLRQGSMSVTDYYAKLKGIWDHLDQYVKTETCDCGLTCKTLVGVLQEKENEKVYKFLMGLDDRYGTIRSSIIAMDPLPSLTRCFAMISKEELQLRVGQHEDPRMLAAAFATRGRSDQWNQVNSGRNSGEDAPFCSHCKRAGHDKSRCFELIGYPEHWKNRGGGRAGCGRGRNSGNQGHKTASVNAIQGRSTAENNESRSSNNTVPMPSLTQSQLDRLMSLLGTGESGALIHDALSGPHPSNADWTG